MTSRLQFENLGLESFGYVKPESAVEPVDITETLEAVYDPVQLPAAIDKADPSVLRLILKALVKSSEFAGKDVAKYLLVARHSVSRKRKAEDGTTAPSNKRSKFGRGDATSRFETCTTCQVIFDVTENHTRSCNLHPGKQVVHCSELSY